MVAQESDVQATAARVDALLASFNGVSTPRQAREQAEELARTLVALYGAGLERVLTIIDGELGEGGAPVFDRLCEDPLVESLLCLHGLHPIPVRERVHRALESVRPYLKSHAGGIELLGVDDGVALLRLEGSCDGCPSSSATVKLAVERAILEQVPEITAVRVENVMPVPARTTSLRIESEWIALAELPELAQRGFARREIGGTPLLLAQFADEFYAYRDRCAACAEPFAEARLEPPLVVCAGCGASFDLARAGRALTDEQLFIEPFPLMREVDRIRVAIPVGA
jgi:Fe-S cluster biogenesis protein NfuA/nitrite reductase/ring-hydroxylating ferredoxin subunit